MYRIAQEALTNVAKHASGATAVGVVIERIANVLHLTIEDNGRGFDPEALVSGDMDRADGGLGLAGMRERLSLIDGELEVESSRDAGTTVFARIRIADDGTSPR